MQLSDRYLTDSEYLVHILYKLVQTLNKTVLHTNYTRTININRYSKKLRSINIVCPQSQIFQCLPMKFYSCNSSSLLLHPYAVQLLGILLGALTFCLKVTILLKFSLQFCNCKMTLCIEEN